MSERNLSVVESPLKQVPLDRVRDLLNENLTQYFAEVKVSITDCPDLTQEPYNQPVAGFGGGSCDLVDLGGVKHMFPTPDKSGARVYDLRNVASTIGTSRFPNGWYMTGAGAGPWPVLGSNSEMILSLLIGSDGQVVQSNTKVALTTPGDEKDVVFQDLNEPTCAILANFLVSSPIPGKVLEIRAQKRTDSKADFVGSIRKVLDAAFPNETVGMGGFFLVKNANTYTHIMRDFIDKPLNTDEEIDKYFLKFFEMGPPFLVQSILISSDPGLDLRIEHSHGYSLSKKEGGHYHHDLDADNVEYVGYYVVAETLWRIDRPPEQQ